MAEAVAPNPDIHDSDGISRNFVELENDVICHPDELYESICDQYDAFDAPAICKVVEYNRIIAKLPDDCIYDITGDATYPRPRRLVTVSMLSERMG